MNRDVENGASGKDLNSWTNLPVVEVGKTADGAPPAEWRRYLGIICALIAAICFNFSTLTGKVLSQRNYHAFSIAIWRNQGMTIFVPMLILYIRYVKKEMIFDILLKNRGKYLFFLVLRGSLGFIALVFFLFSLRYLNLADATVISFSTPIAVTLFARICLGEPCGVVPILMALVTMGGVVILTRPPMLTGEESFNGDILIGTLLAVGCMVFLASVFVAVRYLRKVHFSIVILFYGYVASIEGLIMAAFLGIFELPRTQEDWMIVVFSAIITGVGQGFMTLSLKFEAAGPIALVRTVDIVIANVLQMIFLGVYPDFIGVVGAAIIVFGVVVITCRKWLAELPEKHPNRIKFWFLLK